MSTPDHLTGGLTLVMAALTFSAAALMPLLQARSGEHRRRQHVEGNHASAAASQP